MGIPFEEIPQFVEASYWTKYFTNHWKRDLIKLGTCIDWRRSFTTEANPYYESFIQWQFQTLRDLGKLKFGKRYVLKS